MIKLINNLISKVITLVAICDYEIADVIQNDTVFAEWKEFPRHTSEVELKEAGVLRPSVTLYP